MIEKLDNSVHASPSGDLQAEIVQALDMAVHELGILRMASI